MTAQSDKRHPDKRHPVKRMLSTIMTDDFIKRNSSQLLKKTSMTCLPVKVENRAGRIVIEFGGYTVTTKGGVKAKGGVKPCKWV